MNIGFYAPLKSPHHPVPSGDRRMARLLLRALEESGHRVTVISLLRSWEGRGDRQKQQEIQQQAGTELTRIRHRGLGHGLDMVFVYHLYHRAPDWIGVELSWNLTSPMCWLKPPLPRNRRTAHGAVDISRLKVSTPRKRNNFLKSGRHRMHCQSDPEPLPH